ncbi:MAG: prolyl oligopeptidase family serine peptidase [Chloroflexota bacterium]|nr:prolyl oligopeptidase family serine peptidase [Chloroflexota bacterium]
MHPQPRHPRSILSALAPAVLTLAVVTLAACGSGPLDPPASASPAAQTSLAPTMPPPSADIPASAEPQMTAQPPWTDPPSTADDRLFAYDASLPLRPLVDGSRSRETEHANLEYLSFAAPDGERVPALFARPRDVDDPTACILLGHGLGGDKESFQLYEILARAGFASLAIDARSHGERLDLVTLERLGTRPRALERLLRETVIDQRRAIDYLATRPECDLQRTGYLGISLGGFLGTLLAGVDERVQAPILVASGADWATLQGAEGMGLFGRDVSAAEMRRRTAVLEPIDPRHWAGRISPRPVLMIAGDADLVVPPASARALHAAAREPRTVLWYEGGHAVPSGPEAERVFGRIALWLIEHLGRR